MENLIKLEIEHNGDFKNEIRVDNSTEDKDFIIKKSYLKPTEDKGKIIAIQKNENTLKIGDHILIEGIEFQLFKEFINQ